MLVGLASRSLCTHTGSNEVSSTVTLEDRHVTADGRLFAPTRPSIRGVIVILSWGIGRQVYEDPHWRDLASRMQFALLLLDVKSTAPVADGARAGPEQQVIRNAPLGGGQAVRALLTRFAERPEYRELQRAPWLPWGFSAAGSFAMTLAAMEPERTIAFVRYQSHLRNLPIDLPRVTRIPALLLAGGDDTTAGTEDSQQLWSRGRAAGAPWTFGILPGLTHGQGLAQAGEFMLAWIEAVVRQRVAETDTLREVSDGGWVGSLKTLSIGTSTDYKAPLADLIWLPDERSAKLWQRVVRQSPQE